MYELNRNTNPESRPGLDHDHTKTRPGLSGTGVVLSRHSVAAAENNARADDEELASHLHGALQSAPEICRIRAMRMGRVVIRGEGSGERPLWRRDCWHPSEMRFVAQTILNEKTLLTGGTTLDSLHSPISAVAVRLEFL